MTRSLRTVGETLTSIVALQSKMRNQINRINMLRLQSTCEIAVIRAKIG